MRVSRADLQRFLDGHRAASARLRAATLKRVAALSVEESRAEYDALCRVWEHSRAAAAQAALDRRAIADRIALRRRLAGHR